MTNSIGMQLKRYRKLKGWSQLTAANRIGVSNTVLSNYERDYRTPDPETLKKIAEVYDVSVDNLLSGIDVVIDEIYLENVKHNEYMQTVGRGQRMSAEHEQLFNDPDVQFIARAKKDLPPKAFQRMMELAKKAKEMFEDEDEEE